MNNIFYIALIPLLPLINFLLLGLFGQKHFARQAGVIGTLVMGIVTALALYTAYNYFWGTAFNSKVDGFYQPVVIAKYTWLQFSKGLSIDMGLLLDPASVLMIVVVCFISLMVHVFSLAYMKGEQRFAVYYSFLSLFTFSMLGLVLSTNILQTYIFWELVGVSSFLLIGFYYDKPSAVAAAKKAFIVTRFADLGFLIGILILAWYSGTLDIGLLTQRLTDASLPFMAQITGTSFMGISMLSWALVLVFIGGAGKSAMFPLHIWLPDAMEGPTPVSALIHAATMVVAGVYLVARLYGIYLTDVHVLHIITWIGAISALFAAIIACTQTDIKRVLAYSTISQIGYMFMALGVPSWGQPTVEGFTACLFHLFTHAFFKSLLFLGAGSVIHFIHSNDMSAMGGLKKWMPVTHTTFLIACLAIAGIPPFAGFFSKESILHTAHEHNPAIYFLALITSGVTAFYMFRLYFSIFRNRQHTLMNHEHGEGATEMRWPLIILAAITVMVGFVPFGRYISFNGTPIETTIDLIFSITPVVIAVLGIALAYILYNKENEKPQRIATVLGNFYQLVYRKFYIDELYLFITKKIIFNVVARPAAWIDKNIVDGCVNASAFVTARFSERIKAWQSGSVQNYALYFFGGMLAIAALFIYWMR
jgi:NADH-quinone oxidoreductase subunit L